MNNKKSNHSLLFAVMIGAVVGLAGVFLLGTLVGALLAIGVAGIVYFFYHKQTKVAPSAADVVTAPTLDSILDDIAQLNLTLRLTCSVEIARNSIEQTIDILIALLPRVHKELEDGELKWVVNRIATDYLPNRAVLPYLALDKDSQSDDKVLTDLISGQQAMRDELKEIDDLLSQKKSDEFQAKAIFIKHRFNI
ncbi:MAG: hypothetical protein CSA50_00195 [Gammaproteobacteria bacterium]|nr:MAG: hypothetical protein CSA50_00195 [Gammaproteobacteria bacterium]